MRCEEGFHGWSAACRCWLLAQARRGVESGDESVGAEEFDIDLSIWQLLIYFTPLAMN